MKTLIFVLLIHSPLFGFSQDLSNTYIRLPIEFYFEIKGIPVKLVLDSLNVSPRGSFADFQLGFQNPETKNWLWFRGSEVPFSKDGFLSDLFEVTLTDNYDISETDFLHILFTSTTSSRTYKWKCDCVKDLPKIVL
jgi:hypothetical protein